MTEDNDWQAKYEQEATAAAQKEAQWEALRELLAKAVSRLSIAAEGQHPRLDPVLGRLRDAVREGDRARLTALVEELSRILSELDEFQPGNRGGADPRQLLARMVERLKLPRRLRGEAGKLREQLLGGEAALEMIAEQLAELVERALRGEEQPGLLKRFLERVEPAEQAAAVAGIDFNLVLLRLLEKLSIPDEFTPRAETLKQHLLERSAGEEWSRAVDELVDLIAGMAAKTQREKRDLETFLHQVIDRLHELDEHLRGTEVVRQKSVESGRQLDAVMKEQMRGMSDSVRSATDLTRLKRDVAERMEAISKHMLQFRKSEDERNVWAERQVQHLTQRLHNLEEETQKLRQKVRQEHHKALHDPLTGLFNRLALEEHLVREHARWKRYGHDLALMVVDLDHFKKINDTYGHAAGDMVLKKVAGLLTHHLRKSDVLARFGGEEFIILLPETDLAHASAVAEKLRAETQQLGFHHHGQPVKVTMSVGITCFRGEDTPETAFERADAALYRAKEGGRNRCVSD